MNHSIKKTSVIITIVSQLIFSQIVAEQKENVPNLRDKAYNGLHENDKIKKHIINWQHMEAS